MNFFDKKNESNNIVNDLLKNTHTSGWKYAFASVIGTSHIASNTKKQDSCKVEEHIINDVAYLFSAVADGAGSAKYSDVSSGYICKLFTRKAKSWLSKNKISELTRDVISSWFILFQQVITRAVKLYHLESTREFATTLLFAILSEKGNIFIQIGDGIMAKGNSLDINCIFLPQNGEYINTTFFATDKNITERFMFEYNTDNIKRLILHTDGIELISFNFANMKPHVKFFNPIFDQLESSDGFGLNNETSEFISGFLNCERVNQKTDDDKTLVIISALQKEINKSKPEETDV